MSNRESSGRWAKGQEMSRANNANQYAAAIDQTAGIKPYKPSAKEQAEKALFVAKEHEREKEEAQSFLRHTGSAFGEALTTHGDRLYQWFKHIGFWPAGWDSGEAGAASMGCFEGSPLAASSTSQDYVNIKKAEKIALIHSELSEMLEAVRKGDAYNEAEELADTLVRLLDYAGGFGIDLGGAYYRKMMANLEREPKHGKQF